MIEPSNHRLYRLWLWDHYLSYPINASLKDFCKKPEIVSGEKVLKKRTEKIKKQKFYHSRLLLGRCGRDLGSLEELDCYLSMENFPVSLAKSLKKVCINKEE